MMRASEKQNTRYEFNFKNIRVDADLQKKANLKLVELLALAPLDASAFGTVEDSGDYFISTVEVKSRYKTFVEKAAGTSPHSAVNRVLEKLENKLYQWRCGGNSNSSPAQLVRHYNSCA
jgi:hypothetical protein